MSAEPPVLISICLCTARRASLRNTLESLATLDRPPGTALELIVADNDPEASARETVHGFAQEAPFPVVYGHEPERGISQARNATLRAASGRWLAFIDDDEMADPDWLVRLYETARSCKAEVVAGTVLGRFSPDAPPWMIRAGLHDKHPAPTGRPMADGWTCNALVLSDAVREHQVHFDPAFSRTGSEDSDFFQRLKRHGYRIVGCREAVVREDVPTDRATVRYLMRRSVRAGENYARVFLARRQFAPDAVHMAASAAKAATAGVLMAASLPFGRARAAYFLVKLMLNAGKMRYLAGVAPIEFYVQQDRPG